MAGVRRLLNGVLDLQLFLLVVYVVVVKCGKRCVWVLSVVHLSVQLLFIKENSVGQVWLLGKNIWKIFVSPCLLRLSG
jgi:hypothetical protein